MKKVFLFFIALVVVALTGKAQFSRYLVKFRNKATTPFALTSPLPYLSQRAIDRRTRYTIAIDSTDLPVTPRYIDSVRMAGAVTILNTSRWLNQVSIQTTDAAALAKIAAFAFVQSVGPIASRVAINAGKTENLLETGRTADAATAANTTADYFNYGASYNQVHIHNGEFLHNIGLRGQNMVIGILDGGFKSYTTLRSFDSANAAGQVLGTYDFVAREQSVVEDDSHGMQCFSVIAANIPGQFVGTAPKANFYLFRTEDGASEFRIEEHNWVCAAERLDSAGGDVISCSLGYSDFMTDPVFNHPYSDMNGNTTIAAIGADLGAKKGLLIVNSAGNQGAEAFHFISTPADGDSVMAVGAVSTNGAAAGFSSYGPSSDGQVKPDVASVGVNTVVQNVNNTIGTNNGTSFSTPNMAGLATCLWQGFPEFNNIKILNALRQSGSKVTTPDDRVGYGIPDVKKAVLGLLKDFSTATVTASACKNTVSWTSKDALGMKYEIERKAPGETVYTKIGERPGSGPVFSNHTYSFADSLINVQAGLISYRVRQLIDTVAGTFAADYIDTVAINLTASCVPPPAAPVVADGTIIISPNPAGNTATVKITTSYPIPNLLFQIIAGNGQVVGSYQRSKAGGTSLFDLPILSLAKGKYYMAIYNEKNRMAVKEFMKL